MTVWLPVPGYGAAGSGWTGFGGTASAAVAAVFAGVLTAAATWLVLAPPSACRTRRLTRRRIPGVPGWWRPALASGPGREAGLARVSDLAEVADLLALVLGAGRGVAESLELVGGHYPGPLGRQLCTVAAAGRWGLDEEEQWAAVAPEWAPIRRALRIASESGAAPAQALAAAAEDLRRAEAHRVEVAASAFGAKAVLPLGLAFLPAFVLTTVVPVVVLLAGDLIGT